VGFSRLAHCDEQGVSVSRILSFVIATDGVSRLARCDERSVSVSRILMFVIVTSGSFLSRALRRAGRSRLAHLDVCHHDEQEFSISRAATSGTFPSRDLDFYMA
jgi:hypothetical protein